MPRRPIFVSFSYQDDVMRVKQILNMGAIEGQPILSPNEWESVRKSGNQAIKKWIDENMKNKQCVVVMIGENTANRPWVRYEISKAWNEKRPLFGIYIHNIADPNKGTSKKGDSPFSVLGQNANRPEIHDPHTSSIEDLRFTQVAYRDIKKNIENWIEEAISQRKLFDMFGI